MAYQGELPGGRTDAFRSLEAELEAARLQLETVESRLGTSLEKAGDFDHANEIAHRLKNIQTLLNLRLSAPR